MLHTEEETSVVHEEEEEGGKSTMKAGEVSADAGIVADADGLEEAAAGMKDAERRRLLQMEPLVVDETAVDDADEGGYDCCCC